jgi:hypothetical protein
LRDRGIILTEWQRPDWKDSPQRRQGQRVLQLAAGDGFTHGLLGHQLDGDHFSFAYVLFMSAFNVFGQPVMAEVIVEGGIGLYCAQIGPFVRFVASLFEKLTDGRGLRIFSEVDNAARCLQGRIAHAESILSNHDRALLRVQGNHIHPVGRFEHEAFEDLAVARIAKAVDPLFKQDQTGVLIPRIEQVPVELLPATICSALRFFSGSIRERIASGYTARISGGEDPARSARQVLAGTFHGVLSTHSLEHAGCPFGSVLPYVLNQNCACKLSQGPT